MQFRSAFGVKYLKEEIKIPSGVFPGDLQYCQFKEALPYRAMPEGMGQSPASVQTPVAWDILQMLEAEVAT